MVLVIIGLTVFPLIGVINFQTNGLIGGFAIGMGIALVVSMLKKEEQ